MLYEKTVARKNIIFVGLCVLMLGLCVLGKQALAQTHLALHATKDEVDIWKQRSVHGPYLDDWNRIQSRANSFLSNSNAETWQGNQLNTAWGGPAVHNGQQPPNAYPGRTRGDKLRDAGFVYLVTGNTTYRDAVRSTLLTQASIPGTKFSNTTKWPTSYDSDGFPQSGQQDFEITNWLRKLAYGYSYIRLSLSSGDKATLDTWFNNAATFWATALHNMVAFRFPKRLNDDYAACSGSACPGSANGITHFGGPTFYSFHYGFNNIVNTYAAVVAAVGVITDNTPLKNAAKRYVKEWLMFCVSADGTICDQYRWKNGNAQTGFLYAGTALGTMITIADHLARAGDTDLYTFSTSAGFYGWGGGAKTLLKAMQRFAKITIAERGLGAGVNVYASTTSTTDPAKRIGPNTTYTQDINLIPGNVYYRDSAVVTAYTRSLPSNPSSGGYDVWGGDWGTYPGIRFMFGQMEGVVQPYNNHQNNKLPPPTTLRIVTQ